MQPPDPGPSGARPGVEPPSRKTVVVDELPTGPYVLGGELEPGRGLELVGKAGEGAMGEVLVATDRDLNRTVAFKVMSHQLAASPRQAARFYAEAQITAQLDHPGIVPIHGLGRSDDGRLGYTMKLVRGRTLAAWIAELSQERSHPPLVVRLEVFLKLCDAVGYAHDQGVLHRDLKPENVMLGDHGEVYVMDWGVAALLRPDGPVALQVPTTAVVLPVRAGTPGFVAPEVADGGVILDVRTDLYALGVILRELVTLLDGRLAPGSRPWLDRFGHRVPVELRAIVSRATARRPERRYPTVGALAADVRRFLQGAAVDALPDNPWQALLRWTGNHRVAMLVLLVGSILVGVAGVGWSQAGRQRDRWEMAESERMMTELVGQAAAQAGRMDARLVRYEGLAQALAATALERWRHGPPTRGPVYLAHDFADSAFAPPDLAPSPFYGTAVSVDHPVLMVDPPDPPRLGAAARLATLGPFARDLMLRSTGAAAPPYPDRARALIVEHGLSPAFLSVAFEEGVWFSYPGHGAFPPGYDARRRPWYTVAVNADGPVWGAPYVDAGGLGLLLPCSVPLREGDALIGVASIKLPVASVIGDLLQVGGGEAFVLDGQGRVVVRTSQRTDAGPELVDAAIEGPLFDLAEAVEGARAARQGWARVGTELVTWHPLQDIGWTFVVRGHEAALRAAAARP